VGRRSRKHAGTTRAERDAARRERAATEAATPARRRAAAGERPPPPWGKFPLSELLILAGLVVMIWGFFSANQQNERIAGGLALASLGGGELALREHLGGYKSHSTLLAGVTAFVVVSAVALGLGPVKVWVLAVVAVAVFAGAFYGLREVFKRRSGGLGFR
jgi:hypothetical protein